MAADDGAYMRRALDLAQLGWGHTAPNPLVGAVLVRDGEIVGEGHHAVFGGDHAEVVALRAAGARAGGATAYVTLEPCTHTGQTPPCVDALIAAGVARVIIASEDPNPAAAGGIRRLKSAGIETTVGIEADAARELNAPFFHSFRSDRAWVTLKLAVSLDGAVADRAGTRGRFTSTASQREVHRLRAGADAVAVGIGTVLTDDPLLTVREGVQSRVPPVRVVFDRRGRLPLDSRLVRSIEAAPLTVVTAPEARAARDRLTAAGATVITASTVGDALAALRGQGIRSLLLEGGPRLAGAFLTACVVDRLIIFQAPIILGAGAVPALAFAPTATLTSVRRLDVIRRSPIGDDLMTVYALSNA